MSSPQTSLFLQSLSPESREWLVSRSTFVNLPVRTALYVAESPPDYAYMMTSGVASIVAAMADGKAAEVGLIGREGIVGSLHLLGPSAVPTECFVQITATAIRIPLSDLRIAFRTFEEIRDRILEFVQEQVLSLGQLAGCNRLHEQEERLARWLLMVKDRTESDSLDITQEFLAEMLGAKRTTVTVVAGTLQRAGLIEYRRGHVRILKPSNLVDAACDCYPVLRKLYASLYRQPWISTVQAATDTNVGNRPTLNGESLWP